MTTEYVNQYHKQILNYVEEVILPLKNNINTIKDLEIVLDLLKLANNIGCDPGLAVVRVPVYDIKFDRLPHPISIPALGKVQMDTLEGGPTVYRLVQNLAVGDYIIIDMEGFYSYPKIESIALNKNGMDICLMPDYTRSISYNRSVYYKANFKNIS